jgi:hypothetical protein
MVERSARASAQQQRQQDQYIRDVAGTSSPTDEITRARALLDDGAISPGEYDALKNKALAGV